MNALAVVGYYEPWYVQIIKAIVIFAVGLQLVPVVLMAERKIMGRMQGRYGPTAWVHTARCSPSPTSSSS